MDNNIHIDLKVPLALIGSASHARKRWSIIVSHALDCMSWDTALRDEPFIQMDDIQAPWQTRAGKKGEYFRMYLVAETIFEQVCIRIPNSSRPDQTMRNDLQDALVIDGLKHGWFCLTQLLSSQFIWHFNPDSRMELRRSIATAIIKSFMKWWDACTYFQDRCDDAWMFKGCPSEMRASIIPAMAIQMGAPKEIVHPEAQKYFQGKITIEQYRRLAEEWLTKYGSTFPLREPDKKS